MSRVRKPRHEVLAPNGARVVFTTQARALDAILRWSYEPFVEEMVRTSAVFDVFTLPLPGRVAVAPVWSSAGGRAAGAIDAYVAVIRA